MKKQIKTIRESNLSMFDNYVNEFLNTIDYSENSVKMHYRYDGGYHVVMIEVTEEDINPLLSAIRKSQTLNNLKNSNQ